LLSNSSFLGASAQGPLPHMKKSTHHRGLC
jgi:hypothetical protein